MDNDPILGLDCTLVLYAGRPQELEQLATVYANVVSGKLGTTTLGIRHAPNALRARPSADKRTQLNAIATYEKVGRYSLHVPEAAIAEVQQRAAAEDFSLSQLLQAAHSMTRKAILEGRIADARPGEPKQDLPDEWLQEVASELSRVAGPTMWITCCDHSGLGGYTLFDDGKVLEAVVDEGEHYERIPSAAVSKLAGRTGIAIHDLFVRNFDGENFPIHVIAEEGTCLPTPRQAQRSASDEFELVL